MTPGEPILVNAQPLRIKTAEEPPKNEQEIEEEAYESAAYKISSGVVICYSNGIGEVLTSETFDDSSLHFMFTKATCLQYPSEYDQLGIGSVVQIYYSRSFDRIIQGSHVIIQIEKMEIYKCAQMIPATIFVTFNSHSTPGVAIGVTERNITVAFHPNCSPRIRCETLKAHRESRTEFELKHKHRENTNRMVNVMLAAVPFRVEINGNVDKIPFFVIKKIENAPGKHGVAVITKIMKHHFMEAYFLHSSERVYFNSKSCHSNILEKVTIGSLINVHATPTFPTSFYKWYGYDVTMCNNYLADVYTQRSFVMENNQILQNFEKKGDKKMEKPSAKREFKFEIFQQKRPQYIPKKKLQGCSKFNSRNAQYKMRHLLLDQCYSLLVEREARETINSYFVNRMDYGEEIDERNEIEDDNEEEESDEKWNDLETGAMYSDSLQDGIIDVLEEHGLRNLNPNRQKSHRNHPHTSNTAINSVQNPLKPPKKRHDYGPKLTEEDVRKRIGTLLDSDGFALNQRVKPAFVLPDTQWKHRERRYIGLDDDLQWVMMATFCPPPENPMKKELLGGWWYRRTVPRDGPVGIVPRMETRRNVIKDCTESIMLE